MKFLLAALIWLVGCIGPAFAADYVPDETTAIAIAEAILRSVLGGKLVDQIKPFSATRDGNNWLIVSQPKLAPGVYGSGGAVVVQINRETGTIIDWSTVH